MCIYLLIQFYLILYRSQSKTTLQIKTINYSDPIFTLTLQGDITNCHYNSQLKSYIFTKGNFLYILKDIGQGRSVLVDERKLESFGSDKEKEDIVFCKSHDNVVICSTRKEVYVYYVDVKEKQKVCGIKELLEKYGESEDKFEIRIVEYKNEVVLIAFDGIPYLFHFNVNGEKIKVREIPFSSNNFLKFKSILIDNSSTTVLLFTQHYQACITQDSDQLSLASPQDSLHRPTVPHSPRTYLKASILHLNIMNTIYAIQHLLWSTFDYYNILTSPWSKTYFIHTKRRILTEAWSFNTDECLSSAIHPTSLFIAVGYKDCFKIYGVLSNSLYNTNGGTNLKQCTSLCYSPNGHHLAVASNNCVYIFDSYSYCKVGFIPQQNTMIRDLKYRGEYLLSKSRNGNCFVYSVSDNYSRSISFYPKDFLSQTDKHVQFQHIEYDSMYDIFIVSWNKTLKFYTNKGTIQLSSIDLSSTITSIHISRQLRTMFLGTSLGEVISFPWPNNPQNLKFRHPKKLIHSHPIQHIRISNNYRQIICVSSAGVLNTGRLKIISQTRQIRPDEISYENMNRVMMNNILKQHQLVFHSVTSDEILREKIKDLGNTVGNDGLVNPIEEQKCLKMGKGKLEKEKEGLRGRNREETEGMDQEYGMIRGDIREIRKRKDGVKGRVEEEIEEKRREFYEKQEILMSRKRQLQKKMYRIMQLNKQQIRILKKSQQQQHIAHSKQHTHSLALLAYRTQSQNLDYTLPPLIDSPISPQQTLSSLNCPLQSFTHQISSLLYSNIDLTTRNAKLISDITALQFKIKDLKDPITDLYQQIKQYDPKINQQLSQKQEQIVVISKGKMKEKEEIFMKTVKETVRVNKVIEIARDDHGELVEGVERLEEKIKEVEGKTEDVQGEIVEQKGIGVRNGRMERELGKVMGELKRRRKEVMGQVMNSANVFKREIQQLTLTLQDVDKIKILIKKTWSLLLSHPVPFSNPLPFPSPKPTLPSDKLKRSHTQLQKITRALYACQRVDNTMTNIKKIFNNHSLRAYDQNQDLIEYWNTLRFEREKLKKGLNKTMENVEIGMGEKKEGRVVRKMRGTPFQEYHEEKGRVMKKRRMKTCGNGEIE